MKRKHPHFDDRGTLDWHTTLDEALAAAKADGKLVFVEMGREQCSQCRSLVESVVPQADIARLLQNHAVALASDIDAPEAELIDLAANNMPDAMMLPFVMLLDAEGQFLAGSHGSVQPRRFQDVLQGLVDKGD